MRHAVLLACAICLSLAVNLFAAPALGQPGGGDEAHAQGRELAGQGLEAYQDGNYEEARQLFEQARALYPTGQVLRMLGYSLMAQKRWLRAAVVLEEALNAELKPLSEDDLVEVRENLETARSHIATVTIRSGVAGAMVAIDGGEPKPLPLEQEPMLEGSHSFVVSAEEHQDLERTVALEGGEATELVLDPTPIGEEPPPPPPPPKPKPEPEANPWPIIGGATSAVGLAALGFGIGTLVEGLAQRDVAQDRASEHTSRYGTGCAYGDYESCVYDAAVINRQSERAETVQQLGIGLTITGVVLTTAGIITLVAASDGPTETEKAEQASLSCGPFGPAGLGCRGQF